MLKIFTKDPKDYAVNGKTPVITEFEPYWLMVYPDKLKIYKSRKIGGQSYPKSCAVSMSKKNLKEVTKIILKEWMD